MKTSDFTYNGKGRGKKILIGTTMRCNGFDKTFLKAKKPFIMSCEGWKKNVLLFSIMDILLFHVKNSGRYTPNRDAFEALDAHWCQH